MNGKFPSPVNHTAVATDLSGEMQSPTWYTGIYATRDGDGHERWDFGTASDYPMLRKIDYSLYGR